MANILGKKHRINIVTAYLKNPAIFHPETAGTIETWKEYEETKKAQKRLDESRIDETPTKENTRTKARAKAKRLLRYG